MASSSFIEAALEPEIDKRNGHIFSHNFLKKFRQTDFNFCPKPKLISRKI